MARQLLSEAEGYELLKNAGIPVPRFSLHIQQQKQRTLPR